MANVPPFCLEGGPDSLPCSSDWKIYLIGPERFVIGGFPSFSLLFPPEADSNPDAYTDERHSQADPGELDRFGQIGPFRYWQSLAFERKRLRQKGRKRERAFAISGGEDDRRMRQGELGQSLTAGAAGRAGSVVQIGDRDGFHANLGSELGNGTDQCGTLSADGQPVAHIFDVRSSDDLSVGQPESRAYAEAGVGRVGVKGGLAGLFEEVFERLPGRVLIVHRSSNLLRICEIRLKHTRNFCT